MKKATIALSNGTSFAVEAIDLNEANLYVQAVELNGKIYDKTTISYQDILNGGTLKFCMGSQPKK